MCCKCKEECKGDSKGDSKDELMGFIPYCKEFITYGLEDYRNYPITVYACDLGIDLTQSINVDGSATYSSWKAKEYLRHWWDEAAEYWEYEKDNFGVHPHNPFENPEAYHVCMIIWGVNELLHECRFVSDNWEKEIELNPETVDIIINEINELEEV